MNRKLLVQWFLGITSLTLIALSLASPAYADGPVIEKKTFERKPVTLGPQPLGVSKSYGNATVTLTIWLRYYDYGNYEDVGGRDSSGATNVGSSSVNYLEAGGSLLQGGYPPGGSDVHDVNTGNVPNVTSVDTGWTPYHRGYNQLWIMTGHSYWDIWVGSYRWVDNVWGDNSHQF